MTDDDALRPADDVLPVTLMTPLVPLCHRFGNVVEHCPLAAGAVWASRPFSDVNDIHECVSTFLDSLPYHGMSPVLHVPHCACDPCVLFLIVVRCKKNHDLCVSYDCSGLYDL